MSPYIPLFDPADADTPEGMATAVSYNPDGQISAEGTGLLGLVYVPDSSIWSIPKLLDIIAQSDEPTLAFTATEVSYGGNKSDTTVSEFLGADAASLTGDGTAYEMGPSGIAFTGYIYIPPGTHEISVVSDDGFSLAIGGQEFSSFEGTRAVDETARVADFEGGLYEIDLLYFDAGGKMSVSLEIDGLPVDQSAYYKSVEDFQNIEDAEVLIPEADYHPSFFLGSESLETPVDGTGTETRDILTGNAADDLLQGLGGDDELYGGYGDDILEGGDGDDILDGGFGSDILMGGAGNDTLIARSDAGEQRIGQLAIDAPTRDDPDGEVDEDLQKLSAYANQPLVGDDVLIGGEGADTFLIAPQINAKLDIIQKHINADGTINWAGVAGENDELHDHWVDSFGIDIIADYDASEDHIAVIGHTANVFVTHADVIGDEALESIITTISLQHGGGGAHDKDLIGQVIVHGDLVNVEDIVTDNGVTYGVVDNYADVAQALAPLGDEKLSDVDGEIVKGYDTRSPATEEGFGGPGPGTNELGAITGNPADYFDNANFSEDMLQSPDADDGPELTRGAFDQLGFEEVQGVEIVGNQGANTLAAPEPDAPDGLPGAIGYWSFAGGENGAFSDDRAEGGDPIKAYELWENQALLRPMDTTTGPDGTPDSALYFDGDNDFAYLDHNPDYEVTQGTISLWVRPDDLGNKSMFVSKDHSGTGEGGHFRFGHTANGELFLRMAPGDGGSNKAWVSEEGYLSEGNWTHLAVSFTDDGVTVYVDGEAVPGKEWTAVEGDVNSPAGYQEAYLLQNSEPWIFGADSYKAENNDTAQEFATDDEDLRHEFEGAISGFGIWGGYSADDALTGAQITDLMENGPGAALSNPTGPEAMLAGDDMIYGGGGADQIDGGAGDDMLAGEAGQDTLFGGYGDDHLEGGSGNDILDGGRGSDLLMGGSGDDVLISRSDTGEGRIGQLVLDAPSRAFPDASVDETYLKLVDWIDQPLIGDDVLVGGSGADTFRFETLINGKMDIILDHVNEDRTIDWMGVAGENDRLHDHWVDGFGIDIIADYNSSEDIIEVMGHTTRVEVDYKTIDTDGDGIDDDAVSIITAYSQQGNNGGAHDEDYLGYIVVHGDRVEVEDIVTDPKVAYGIVDTIDELQEALAPSGETKISGEGEAALFGYDSRDVDGDPIGSDPEAYSSNSWLNDGEVNLASAIPAGLAAPNVVWTNPGGSFDGSNPVEIPHDAALAQAEGTWAFSFSADDPGNGEEQAILSKDHTGYKDGGHLTAYLTSNGYLKLRFQNEEESHYLKFADGPIQAGETYHVAFSFGQDGMELYVNGALADQEHGFETGMLGNTEDLVLGASAMTRSGEDDNLAKPFAGEIGDLVVLDRPIEEIEALFLSESGGDIGAMAALYDRPESEVHDNEVAESEENTAAPASSGSGNFLSKLFDMLLNLFGLGGSDDPVEVAEITVSPIDGPDVLLSELIPVTGMLSDEVPSEPSDEEEDVLEDLVS